MGKEKFIEVIKVEPCKEPEIVMLENDLKSLQKAVGGFIETYTMEPGIRLLFDEEGKLNNKPFNRYLGPYDYIAGTFYVIGTCDGEFTSLPHDKIQPYIKRFALKRK